MRSVLGTIPMDLIQAIGSAKGLVGIDGGSLQSCTNVSPAISARRCSKPPHQPTDRVKRDLMLYFQQQLRLALAVPSERKAGCAQEDMGVEGQRRQRFLKADGKKAVVTLKAKAGPRFAEFITDRLDTL